MTAQPGIPFPTHPLLRLVELGRRRAPKQPRRVDRPVTVRVFAKWRPRHGRLVDLGTARQAQEPVVVQGMLGLRTRRDVRRSNTPDSSWKKYAVQPPPASSSTRLQLICWLSSALNQ